MAAKETGKQRASRIPLDYYKRPDRLERWKLGLAAAALILPVGWLASGLLRSDQGQLTYSRGPVAVVHATWEDNCTRCHEPFHPINGEKWPDLVLEQLKLKPVDGPMHAGNQKCEACHQGPAHHANQKPADLSCGSCHRDHRGRDASLVRMPDEQCTQCHARLPDHIASGQTSYLSFRSFVDDHPPFKILRDRAKDPGRLKFSHKVHLSPGMATPATGDPHFTLANIANEGDRKRYRLKGQQDGDRMKLDCASCHRLDSGDFGSLSALLLPARSPGAHMLPITYENQCRACHPLTLEKSRDDSTALAVPHGQQPKELHQFLEGALVNRYLKNHPMLLEHPAPKRSRPGPPLSDLEIKAREQVEENVLAAEKMLYREKQTCGECHHFETTDVSSLAKVMKPGAIDKLRIQATKVPEVWYTHAVFNHASHRAVQCLACHGAAPESMTSEDVLLPGKAICLECHAPQTKSAGVSRGGARFDCVECHRYHHTDTSAALLQGKGAAARGVETPQKLGIEQFLSGTVPERRKD